MDISDFVNGIEKKAAKIYLKNLDPSLNENSKERILAEKRLEELEREKEPTIEDIISENQERLQEIKERWQDEGGNPPIGCVDYFKKLALEQELRDFNMFL